MPQKGKVLFMLESGVKIIEFIVSLRCHEELLWRLQLVGLIVRVDDPYVDHTVRLLLLHVPDEKAPLLLELYRCPRIFLGTAALAYIASLLLT